MLRAIFVSLVLFAATQSNAKILRLGMEYTTFATAHTAAVAGDTIQVYGGAYSGTATKRLVYIGFGYNFDVHPGLQVIGGESPSSLNLTLQSGSDSSIIEGIEGSISIYVSKIIIRRCRGYFYINNSSNAINDLKILSSVFYGGGMQSSAFPCANLLVYNSILLGNLSMNSALNGQGSSGAVINCVSSPSCCNYLSFGQGNFLVKNSILYLYNGVSGNVNTVYESNFFLETQPATLPQGSNNRWGQVWANLFNRLGGTSDAPSNSGSAFDESYYILKVGSLAINGGTNSQGNPTDCGIFGGEPIYQYTISGVPAIPSVYKLTAPTSSATTNPYNVTISVRSNN